MYKFCDDCQLFEMTKYGFVCGFLSLGFCSHGVHEKRACMHTCACVSVFCMCHGQAHDIIHFVFIYPVIVTPQIWPHFAQDTSIQYHLWWYKSQKYLWSFQKKVMTSSSHSHLHTFSIAIWAKKSISRVQAIKNLLEFTRMQACFFNRRRKKSHCTAIFFLRSWLYFAISLLGVCAPLFASFQTIFKIHTNNFLLLLAINNCDELFHGQLQVFQIEWDKTRRVWKPNRIV